MVTVWTYTVLIGIVAIERLVEVRISNRNATWSFEQGGREVGQGHYPFMVVLHTGFLISCVGEAWWTERDVSPVVFGFWLMISLLCQGLRWWVIGTLGRQWNTRVIIVPNFGRVDHGPFKYMTHPNYLAVVLEGLALPLMFNAYWTAIMFTLLNAALLYVRIGVENRALSLLEQGAENV